MRARAAVVATFMSLLAPAFADASPRLEVANARRAIETYETAYWHEDVSVDRCRRRSAVQVTCVAHMAILNGTATALDWATILPRGIVRVHPAEFTEEIILR